MHSSRKAEAAIYSLQLPTIIYTDTDAGLMIPVKTQGGGGGGLLMGFVVENLFWLAKGWH